MRPTAGFRIIVTLEPSAPDATRAYRGFVHLPDRDVEVTAAIALPSGAVTITPVTVTPANELPAEIVKQAAALVRAATKAEVAAGTTLPRTITRWRG